jgi:hypothetical protein
MAPTARSTIHRTTRYANHLKREETRAILIRILHIDDEAPIWLLARLNGVQRRGLLERLARGERDELRRENLSEPRTLDQRGLTSRP